MALTLVTYGGGEVLYHLFDSLAILLTTKRGEFLNPLMIISLSCGTIWAITKAFFSSQSDALFVRFILPMVAISGLILMPSTSVRIEDVLNPAKNPYKVDNVPWLVAHATQVISTIGYKITTMVETVMHVPNDTNYNSTGMIFGSGTALDIGKYKITNAVLEQNLKRFAKQCVFYDLALEKYTLHQLKTETDLWGFLEANTSKVRMIPYTDPNNPKNRSKFLTCIEAVAAMTPLFEKEKNYYATQDIVKNLPFTFQAMTGLQREKEELVSQQLMIHLLSGEFYSGAFSKSRAESQQRSTYHIFGSLASSSLITLRAVMEAMIYASIIFVLPMSVLPGGISFLSNWLWMMLWIQLWPPFYAILNYVMQTIAQSRTSAVFAGLADPDKGLSFFTSMGLMNLYDDIYAMSGYLAASIPFLAYAVLKGGMSSFMHLAGTLMAPAQSAAAAAAAEQATGNYTFASSSFGQMSYANTTGLQRNLSGSLSAGSFTENQGNVAVTYAQDEAVIRQSTTDTRWGLSSDEAVITNVNSARQTAESLTESSQNTYMSSVSAHARNMSDLTSQLSQSKNFTDSLSDRESYGISESARYLESQASNFSEQHGISHKDSLSLLLGTRTLTSAISAAASKMGLAGSLVGKLSELGGGSWDKHSSRDEMVNSALNIVDSQEFQKHFQKVDDFAQSRSLNTSNDETARYVEGVTRSLDEVRSSQEQFQMAQSRSEQISETASWAEQNTNSVRRALNQDLVNWGTEQCGFEETKRILTQGADGERSQFISDFLGCYRQQQQDFLGRIQEPIGSSDGASFPNINRGQELDAIHNATESDLASYGISRQDMDSLASELNAKLSEAKDTYGQVSDKVKGDVSGQRRELQDHVNSKEDMTLGTRAMSLCPGVTGNVRLSGRYSSNQLPLGWNKD